MKKMLWLLLIVILSASGVFPGQSAVLPEVMNPDRFLLNGNRLYIGEKNRVYIFSLPDIKLIHTFGQPGEGPGEFKLGHGINSLTIDVVDEKLAIGSIGKLSLFTLTGKFLKEVRVPAFSHFVPIKGGYLSSTSLPVGERLPVQGIVLFDPEMRQRKILVKTSISTGMGAEMPVPKPNYKFLVYGDMIYISGDPASIAIEVFDLEGNRRSRISHPAKRIRVPAGYIRKMKTYFQTSPDWKNYWNYLKQYLTFTDYFPAVRDFFIDRDFIYVQTFEVENRRIKWLVFDLNGNLKKEVRLPVIDFYTDQAPLHGIRQGIYYYLEENIEEEAWEVKRIQIN
jgi:hypothetical protein